MTTTSSTTKIAAGVALLGLVACASSPIPQEKIAVAQAAVQHAEQNGAPELAPVQLATAREKLDRAEKAAAAHDAAPAAALADQANIDAQLAEAMATEQRSHKAATELDASLQALRQESSRPAPSPVVQSTPSMQ